MLLYFSVLVRLKQLKQLGIELRFQVSYLQLSIPLHILLLSL